MKCVLFSVFLVCLANPVLGAGPAASADWPCWRGPTGSGGPGDSGLELVTDAKDARFLWASEEKGIGVGWGYRGVGPENSGRCAALSSGYGGLVVADGRGYFVHYVPHGTVVDDEMVAKSGDRRATSWAINADDILLCLDTKNGRTLWKAVFPEKGLSHNWYREGTFTFACVADGKVFFMGTAGRVYALDAVTGKPLWESSVGKGADRCEAIRRDCLKARKVIRSQSLPFDTSPAYADGVVACSDYEHTFGGKAGPDNGLTGLDAGTGKPLWNIPNAVGAIASPVRWVHKGRTYIVAASSGRTIAVEPKTGRILWEVKRRFAGGTPAVCEDYAVICGTGIEGNPPKRSDKETGPICLRVTPDKAETAWELPVVDRGGHSSPLIHRGYAYIAGNAVELATGKVVGKSQIGGMAGGTAGDGRVFSETSMFVAENGQLKAAGRVEARGKASGLETFTTSTLAQGCLFYRGRAVDGKDRLEAGCFYCFDLRKTPDAAAPPPAAPPDANTLAKDPAALLKALHATCQSDRDVAVTAGGKMAPAAKAQLVRGLLTILDEGPENWQAQVAAGCALRDYGVALQPEAPALLTRMKAAIGRHDTGLFDLLGEVLVGTRPPAERRMSVLLAPMRTALEMEKPDIFDDLAAGLCGNTKSAVPGLCKLLPIAPEAAQIGIVEALRVFGRDAAPAGAAMAELMKGPSRNRTVVIVRALPTVAGRDATKPLLDLYKAVTDANPPDKRDNALLLEVLEALKALGTEADAAAAGPALLGILSQRELRWTQNRDLYTMAIMAFTAVKGKDAVPTLLQWFRNGDGTALEAIGSLGPAAQSATSDLKAALAAAKPDARRPIARVISLIRPTNTPPRLAAVPPVTCEPGGTVEIPFTITDDDDSADVVKLTVVEQPAHGRLEYKSPTVLVYQAFPRHSGPDRFRVVAEDARSRSEPVTCTVTIEQPK